MSKQQSELQDKCQEIQIILGITDEKWERMFNTKKGLYGFVEAQLRDTNVPNIREQQSEQLSVKENKL